MLDLSIACMIFLAIVMLLHIRAQLDEILFMLTFANDEYEDDEDNDKK